MALRFRRKLILAKIEAAAGTAEALAATDAVLASNIELTPLGGDTVSRDIEYPYYGNSAQIPVNSHQQLSFAVEIVGGGVLGTPPGWGALLRACGMAEVVTAATKVDYTPISKDEESMTLALNIDGQQHTLAGALGTFTMELGSNAIPRFTFTFTGLWQDPASVAALAPDYSKFKVPKVGSNTNTPTFTFISNAELGLSTFNYDHANSVIHRELINITSEVIITDRAPTGSVIVDAPAYSALNLPKKAREAETGSLQLVHDTTAGDIVEINAPKVQVSGVSYADSNGALQANVALVFVPDDGNDEIKITAR